MQEVKKIPMHMPSAREMHGDALSMFPLEMMPKEHQIKVVAYVLNKKVIDSGTPVDIHVTGHGVVSFRFTPSRAFPEAGASRGVYVPFKEKN
jgi:hypothetical protein